MKKVEHTFSLICICSRFGIPEGRFEKTREEIEKLIPSQPEEEKALRKIKKLLPLKASFPCSKGKTKITLDIIMLPSPKKFATTLSEVVEEMRSNIKKVPTGTMSDKKKKKSLKQLEIVEKESKELYRKYRMVSRSKKGSLFFALRCEPAEDERILDLEFLQKLPRPVKKLLSIVKQRGPKFIPTRNCIRLTYDSKKFKFVGGFSLPTKIPLSQTIVEQLGEADVSGFHLSFENSPLNINRIEIRRIDSDISIFAEFSAKTRSSEKVFQEVYEYGVSLSSLFVEAI